MSITQEIWYMYVNIDIYNLRARSRAIEISHRKSRSPVADRSLSTDDANCRNQIAQPLVDVVTDVSHEDPMATFRISMNMATHASICNIP